MTLRHQPGFSRVVDLIGRRCPLRLLDDVRLGGRWRHNMTVEIRKWRWEIRFSKGRRALEQRGNLRTFLGQHSLSQWVVPVVHHAGTCLVRILRFQREGKPEYQPSTP